MANLILVTGGTGTVGRVVVQHLLDAGRRVRVLSRGRRRPGRAQHVTGDVRTGEGLTAAVAGVDTIVHCVDPAHHVVEAALRAGKPHLVYISIVGVDRVPLGYYRRKRRLTAPIPLPGRVCRAYRAGGHLAPERAVGTISFEQYLGEQLAAGTLPYDDAIRDYTRRPPRKGVR
ncbi:MAG: SDR family oxidoreductase [Pseudonocardiaceae bacterium]